MAPQAKNELGQLFIDFGTKGFPTLLKSLNTVSAQFLLGKNAANQFVQTLTKPFKEAGNSAVEIGKMSNALATSSIEYQKLAMYLKKYNLSESLLGDVEKFENLFTSLSEGYENIPPNLAKAFDRLKLNFMDYKGTFEDTVRLFDDIKKASGDMSKEDRNFMFNLLGISKDWGYLFDKGGRASDFATISDDAIRANQSLQESMNELKNTFDVLKQETLAKIAPHLETIANALTEWMKNFKAGGGVDKTYNAVKGAYNTYQGSNILENATNALPGVGTAKVIYGAMQGYKTKTNKGQTTGQAADLGYVGDLPNLGNAELPPNLSGMVQNITNNITHDITINGNNASEIADRIAAISSEDIHYTQYQAGNLAGL